MKSHERFGRSMVPMRTYFLRLLFGLAVAATAAATADQTILMNATLRDSRSEAVVQADEDDHPALTKIRLSSFSSTLHNVNGSNREAPLVVRLLRLTDASKFTYNYYDYYQSVGAVNVAFKRLAADNIFNTTLIDLEIAHASVTGRSCSDGPAGDLKVVQRIYYALQYKFDAIIGPPCAEGALAVSLFAESLRMPHILWAAPHPDFDNKVRYPYLTQNSVSPELATECMVEMLRQLGNWTRIAYLYAADDYICANVAGAALLRWVKQGSKNFTIAYAAALSSTSSTDEQIRATILEAGKTARIMLTCSAGTSGFGGLSVNSQPYDGFSLRVMSQAFLLGMHTGEYQWIAQKILLTTHLTPPYAPARVSAADLANEHYSLQPVIDSLKLPVSEAQLYEIYRSVLEFDQNYGPPAASYDHEVIAAAFVPPWNANRSEFDALVKSGMLNGHSSRFSNFLADGISLYGRGVQNALDMNLDYTNSAAMRTALRSVSFEGYSGPVAINNNGKRLTDMLLYGPVQAYYDNHPLKRFEKRGVMRCASLPATERAAGLTGKLDLLSPLVWYGAVNNQPPPDTPVCGWRNENCQLLSTTGIALVSCAAGVLLVAVLVLACLFVRRRRRLAALLNTDWNLQAADLTWPKGNKSSSRRTMQSNSSSVSMDVESGVQNSRSTLTTVNDQKFNWDGKRSSKSAMFRGNIKVYVKAVYMLADEPKSRKPITTTIAVGNLPLDCLRELRAMKDADHDNVNGFVGILINNDTVSATLETDSKAPAMFAITSHCAKGTLANVLYGGDDNAVVPPLDNLFKFWIVNDIATGLNYIHNVSHLKCHGRLSSRSVVLDGRWSAKLTDFGFWSFGSACSTNAWLLNKPSSDFGNAVQVSEKLLWVAPEVLRNPQLAGGRPDQNHLQKNSNTDRFAVTASAKQSADVYSFGVVMAEIYTQLPPYKNQAGDFVDNLTVGEIVGILTNPDSIDRSRVSSLYSQTNLPVRPQQPLAFGDLGGESTTETETEKQLETARAGYQLMTDCWEEQPSARPTVRQVVRRLAKMNFSGNKSVMDRIITKLETYAQNLESIVQERTKDLMDEKQRADTLLSRMLPVSVAERLKSGEPVVPEEFEQATIFFSDIVSFTTISSASTPMQVVQLLNDLYTFMDSTLERFAPYVYKVETIGDAYMIVSGIPLRTTLHARILASVALAFLANIEEAVHVPKLEKADPSVPTHVRLRVGLNSGPCVAGVVGLQMPRYCLFGDTVNVASRMESNGEAMRIHISHTTWQALQLWPEFTSEDRGVLHIKGKGEMHTYWLVNGPQSVVY